jgi:tetrahydromethanopterin S-methyltransferase subunit B
VGAHEETFDQPMKYIHSLFLSLLLLSSLAGASALDRARMFDWYYPSEPAYQLLKRVAVAQNRGGWLLSEMQANKSIPQASARELALDFFQNSGMSPEDKQALQSFFGPEAAAISNANASELMGVDPLEAKFAQLNLRMNELEETLKKNNFNKQSYPTLTGVFITGYASNGANGMLSDNNQGYFAGSIDMTLNGQGNGGGFTFGWSQALDTQDRSTPDGRYYPTVKRSVPVFQMGWSDATFEVQLGGSHAVIRHALVQAISSRPGAPNSFNVELESNWMANAGSTAPELKLGLPAGQGEFKNVISLHKQGTAKYWPFQEFEVIYSPGGYDNALTSKFAPNLWGTGVQSDLGSLWGLVDHELMYAVANGTFYDDDRLVPFSLSGESGSSMAWGVGSETLLPWAGQLYLEYGQTSLNVRNKTKLMTAATADLQGYVKPITGFDRRYGGDAFVAAYTHPFGVFVLGLEYSRINPLFTPQIGGVVVDANRGNGTLVNGVDNTNISYPYPYPGAPKPRGYVDSEGKAIIDSDQDLAWSTPFGGATGMMNNTEKTVLQAQLSYSWVSLGLFTGIASQIHPTGPWMHTNPIIEGGDGGKTGLIYQRMGGVWANPPAPLSANPNTTGQSFNCGACNEWTFNRPADGNEIYNGSGSTNKIHWNAISQVDWRKLDYYVNFSEKGVGDSRIALPSIKYINYIAGTLTLNFQDLLGSPLPFVLQMYGESRDLAPQPGFTTFGNPGQAGSPDMIFFNQSTYSAFLEYGWTQTLSSVAILGREEWHSNHSFFPINVGITNYGVGLNIDANKILTGLGIFLRVFTVTLDDYNIAQRQFRIWQSQLSTSLSF